MDDKVNEMYEKMPQDMIHILLMNSRFLLLQYVKEQKAWKKESRKTNRKRSKRSTMIISSFVCWQANPTVSKAI